MSDSNPIVIASDSDLKAMPSLHSSIGKINLENPFILASGILDENGYSIKKILEDGASAAVTKSIGMTERTGYYPPVVVPLDNSMINAVGLTNPGIEEYGHEIAIAKKAGKPVIGSIFGSDEKEFTYLAEKMEKYGATAIELNLSCPHVSGVGHEVGSDPVLVRKIIDSIKSSVKIPVFAKLSPNTDDIIKIAEAADEADGFTLINTVRAMKIDIHAKKPVLSNAYGGLSGPAIKPIGVRYVYEISSWTDKPVMGVGGISSAEDAVEYIMAGASAVQIGTALSILGRGIFSTFQDDLMKFMEKEGFDSISDMKGVALRR